MGKVQKTIENLLGAVIFGKATHSLGKLVMENEEIAQASLDLAKVTNDYSEFYRDLANLAADGTGTVGILFVTGYLAKNAYDILRGKK